MTALPPTDERNVRGVASVRYVGNKICGHPECDKPVESYHHIFPRGTIGNGSWFVKIGMKPGALPDIGEGSDGHTIISDKAIPHVIGLCGSGTTGHHGDLEIHEAWIKLEEGVWNWYERVNQTNVHLTGEDGDEWVLLGPLSPQPGEPSTPGKKARKKTTVTEDKRKSKFIRFRVPDDAEDGSKVIREVLDACREEWKDELGWSDTVGDYWIITAACAKALQ